MPDIPRLFHCFTTDPDGYENYVGSRPTLAEAIDLAITDLADFATLYQTAEDGTLTLIENWVNPRLHQEARHAT